MAQGGPAIHGGETQHAAAVEAEEEELRQVEEEDMAKSSSDEEEDEDKVFKLSEAVKKRKKMERQMKRAQEKVKRLVEKKQLEDQNQESKVCFTSDGRPILDKVYELSESETESEDDQSMTTQNAVIISSSAESIGKMKGLVRNPKDPRNPRDY